MDQTVKEAVEARLAGGLGKRFRMIPKELPSFDGPNIAAQLNCMSDGEFDALPFGVVEMNHKFEVLRCNLTQMRHSKLPPDQVIGHSFFRDLAPWGNNRAVAKRYQVDSLDETIPYTVSLNLQPLAVTLRMLKPAYNERMYLLVTWL
jgi:photoactive yellow protein